MCRVQFGPALHRPALLAARGMAWPPPRVRRAFCLRRHPPNSNVTVKSINWPSNWLKVTLLRLWPLVGDTSVHRSMTVRVTATVSFPLPVLSVRACISRRRLQRNTPVARYQVCWMRATWVVLYTTTRTCRRNPQQTSWDPRPPPRRASSRVPRHFHTRRPQF